MAIVIFYEKPGCGGNQRQKDALRNSGHQLDVRNLLTTPWTATDILAFMGDLPVADWFNRSAPAIKNGDIRPETLSSDHALTLLLTHPLLIRRPLLQVGDQRYVGWDDRAIDAWIGLTESGASQCHSHPCGKSDGQS
jgi:nitrogenase-associated protein